MVNAFATNRSCGQTIRVMVVDDSAVVRGLTKRWLEVENDIEIVAVSTDGLRAVSDVVAAKPDVIILDVEMPRMDGLTALPQLLKLVPHARIIMASTLTREGATTTLRAMSLGAADYISKPEATGLGGATAYQKDLIAKVRALGGAAQAAANPARRAPLPPPRPRPALAANKSAIFRPKVVLIGSSTGGPQALQNFLEPIAKSIKSPIFIVQHMPATFTTILAEKLTQVTGRKCVEPKNGDLVQSDHIYLAPGNWHMRIEKQGVGQVIKLDQSPQVNFCRPSVDPLFQSGVEVFGGSVLSVVLTGMGHDGRDGAKLISEAGGRVIVQDEASSVVWGMPGAIAQAGWADEIKPIPELGKLTLKYMNGVA